MKFEVCMKYECKNCKNKLKCFKEEVDYNEYPKNRYRKTKRGKIQSKKKTRKNLLQINAFIGII